MAEKEYRFQYTPLVGKLPGMTFEQQTEDAINDIGNRTVTVEEIANNALDIANTALNTANDALDIANDAQTKAEAAQETADQALAAANAAQDTADEALAIAQEAAGGVSDNTAAIETVQNTVNEHTTIIQQAQVDISGLQQDVASLETTTTTISTQLGNLTAQTTQYRETDETDADSLGDYGRWLAPADMANTPDAVDGLMDVWGVNDTEDEEGETVTTGGIVQRFQSRETGKVWVRFGTDYETEEDEEDTPDYTFTEWFKVGDVDALTEEEVEEIWGGSTGEGGETGGGTIDESTLTTLRRAFDAVNTEGTRLTFTRINGGTQHVDAELADEDDISALFD